MPKQLLKSQEFQQASVLSAIKLLAEHLSQWCYHVSFPDLATIPLIFLKRFHENTSLESVRRPVKRFIDQVPTKGSLFVLSPVIEGKENTLLVKILNVARVINYIHLELQIGVNSGLCCLPLVMQVQKNSDFIQRKREEVSFSPKDKESVDSFLQVSFPF